MTVSIVSRRRALSRISYPCPAICATICDSMAEQVNHSAASATMPAAQPHQYIRRPLRSREARTTTGASPGQAERRDPRAKRLRHVLTPFVILGAVLSDKPQLQSTIETSQHCRIRRGLSQQLADPFPELFPSVESAEKRACSGSLRHLR